MSTPSSYIRGRRSFLKNTAALSAATLAAGGAAQAAPILDRKLKIGVICVGEFSFMTHSWSDIMEAGQEANNPKNGTLGTSMLNMDITHCWDVNPEAAKKFADRMGATAVKNYDGMVGKIDGLIFSGFYETPWQHLLARPYIEAGIPCYLSRPFAYSLRDIDYVLNLAAKHGTTIMATAKHEHYHEVGALKSRLADVGTISCVHATCNTRDFPVHNHTQFMLMKILGYDVESMSLATDDVMNNNYLVENYIYKGWDKQPPFACTLQACKNKDSLSVTVYGTKSTTSATMVRSPSWQDGLYSRYAPQVRDMQRTFEGTEFEPLENIRKKTELFLTAFYSHQERGGAPVKVGTVSPDWKPIFPKPGWIDESMFKK